MRDVAEIFIKPPTWALNHYLEFEICPNGDWLDLDIAPDNKTILYCDLDSRVTMDPVQKTWTAELAIPTLCFNSTISSGDEWRLNLFRIEGREPKRFYSAWIPTYTPLPNFHVPALFGIVRFGA
jgi:alpha-galactosidase